MLTTIICILAFLFLIKVTLSITWTIIKFFAALIAYGLLFVIIVAVFGFVITAPVLFVAGVIWLLVHCLKFIF
ncbi:MAG: hypothetical protein IKE56_08410 [Lachnospiraceae bacterium]|jgi:hypothetical protein|nr:hypothetical protein [Lachnospiraceae bacterium]